MSKTIEDYYRIEKKDDRTFDVIGKHSKYMVYKSHKHNLWECECIGYMQYGSCRHMYLLIEKGLI